MVLPAQLDTDGEWGDVLARLYNCFQTIFYAEPRLLVQGRLLTCDGRTLDDDKEEGFWHIVSRGKPGERIPDFARARCLPWIPCMLSDAAPRLSRWRYVEGSGKTRQYYWLEDDGYVVILEEGRNSTSLVTAYAVETWGVKDLERRRANGTPF